MPRPFRSVQLIVTLAGALALITVSSAGDIAEMWQSNWRGLAIVDSVIRDRPTRETNSIPTANDACRSHVLAIGAAVLAERAGLPPEQRLELFRQFESCLPAQRRDLLAEWTGNALWAIGEYEEACTTLIHVGAAATLLGLAEQSANGSEWNAVEIALECVPRFTDRVAWVSPFNVSALYFRLGRHYENAGLASKAIAAYDSAARWYPVVWATPMIRKARLLWGQGRQLEAIDYLLGGVPRSSDVTATFELWRELGGYWQEQGNYPDSVCAYWRALQLMNLVPADNLPVPDRDRLQLRVRLLATYLPELCFQSYPQLKTVQPSDQTPPNW